MKFTKMHGLGNDYVYVNGFEEKVPNPEKTAQYVSDRHFGVGSDGLILINPSDKADCEMAMYNADGSRGEMCGNGIRCVAKYVYDHGMTDKRRIAVETLAGVKYIDLEVENGKVKKAEVDMGEPILDPSQIPVLAEENPPVNIPIEVEGTVYHMTCVSMGNPHAVVLKAIPGSLTGSIPSLSVLLTGKRWKCACGSGAPARRWPAVPVPVRRLWRPF